MLCCGHCLEVCESYEAWLYHLVSEGHQAKLGVSEIFTSHKDLDRNERSLIMFGMDLNVEPIRVVEDFAKKEPLGFIRDVYIHQFEKLSKGSYFYLIVFDQKKFPQRICGACERRGYETVVDQNVYCDYKAELTEKEWSDKIKVSFFYRRHNLLKRSLEELSWDMQFTKFLNTVSLPTKGYQDREQIMIEMESLIREEYSEAKVHAFGSCTTWLADVNADLDVYVDALGNGGRSDIPKEEKLSMLDKVATLFKCKYGKEMVFTIKNARVPIIRFTHPSGQQVDISFENNLSVLNSKMIRVMTKFDYRVRPFLIFLRYWARFHDLIGTHSIKSYALVLMAFVFLQKQQILPSVHQLQNVEGTRAFMVCNWNATYCGREHIENHFPRLKCKRNNPSDRLCPDVMKMAYDFFKEMSEVDFETKVVCPLVGDYLPKVAFASQYGVDLPKEMELLKANLVTEQCQEFKLGSPLCIQDPFTLNVNVTACCNVKDVVPSFQAACLMTMETLKPFVSTYDSADTENILELTCCHVSSAKRDMLISTLMSKLKPWPTDLEDEIKTENSTMLTEETRAPDGKENIGYVNDDISTYELNENSSDISSDVASLRGALNSIKDFYSENFSYNMDTQKTKDDSHNDRIRLGRGRGHIRRETDPVKIKRVSVMENDHDLRRRSPDASHNNSFHNREHNSIRISSSPTPTVRNKNDEGEDKKSKTKIKSKVESAQLKKSVDKETSHVVKRDKAVVNADMPATSKTRISENKSSSHSKKRQDDERKRYIDKIVVTVDNKPHSELVNHQSKMKSEPVVKFSDESITSPPLPAIQFQQSLNPSLKETASSLSMVLSEELEESDKIIAKWELNEDETEEEEEDYSIDEQVVNFVENVQQISAPDISVRLDCNNDNNYGYQLTTVVKPKASMAPYIPPPARNSSSDSLTQSPKPRPIPAVSLPKPSSSQILKNSSIKPQMVDGTDLCFPAFGIFLSDEFYQQFNKIILPLALQENAIMGKIKVFWVNKVFELFQEGNLWKKLNPLIAKGSFEFIPLENDPLVYQEIIGKYEDLLKEASDVAYIPNRKRPFTETSEFTSSNGNVSPAQVIDERPLSKFRKTGQPMSRFGTSSQQQIPNMDYKEKADLMSKLSKIPTYLRKNYTVAFKFRCNKKFMESLWSLWETNDNTSDPLDKLGKICINVSKTPSSNDWFYLKLLMALDTTTDLPGLYFGYQCESRRDDPVFEKQALLYIILENLFKEIVSSSVSLELSRYFSK